MQKLLKTKDAIEHGASEIDMVLNIGEMKAGHYDVVRDDAKAVVEAAKGNRGKKVIWKTCL